MKALVIGGNIAAGKSTVAPLLAEELDACLIREPVESWRKSGKLQDFYDGKMSAFDFQMYVLETRSSAFNVQLSLWEKTHEGQQPKYLVLDRWLDDDLVFALVNNKMGRISDEEIEVYKKRHAEISREFSHCLDIRVVWIGTTPEECLKRIHKRGRAEESGITIEYLRALHDHRPEPDLWVHHMSTVAETLAQITHFAQIAWGMTAIVAVSLNGVIGAEGKIPWHEPEDLKFFWNFVKGATIVVGRKTYESIPAKLFAKANVKPIVLSRNPAKGITWDQLMSTKITPEMILIGGANVYKEAFDRGAVSRVVKTTIHRHIEKGDAFFELPEEFSRKLLTIDFLAK